MCFASFWSGIAVLRLLVVISGFFVTVWCVNNLQGIRIFCSIYVISARFSLDTFACLWPGIAVLRFLVDILGDFTIVGC